MKLAASVLHRPPTSNATTTSLQRPPRRSSGYARSLARRASAKAATVKSPRRCRGCPALVRGDTNVVSTASWAPWCNGRPLAMTSMRRLSKRSTDGTFKSESNVWVVTLAPASRHTLAAARSNAPPDSAKPPIGHKLRDGLPCVCSVLHFLRLLASRQDGRKALGGDGT